MGMKDDDDTAYSDIKVHLAQGRELLHQVNTLQELKADPNLDKVFERM